MIDYFQKIYGSSVGGNNISVVNSSAIPNVNNTNVVSLQDLGMVF